MSIFRFGQKLSASANEPSAVAKTFPQPQKTIPCGNVALLRMPVCCKLTLL